MPAALPPFIRRLVAEELSLRRPWRDGRDVMDTLGATPIDIIPHQIEAAVFALRAPLSNGVLLADEVGLGKTIEVGLVVAQLLAEGKRKILILAPASLRGQWQSELAEMMGVPSRIIDGPAYAKARAETGANPFDAADRVLIASVPFAYRRAEDIQRVPWDLVVVDEAHVLRNVWRSENKRARTLQTALAGRRKILVTATPLQNNLMELFGLVSFLDDRALGTPYSFRSQYVEGRDPREGTNLEDLRARLDSIVFRTLRRQAKEYIRFTERHGRTVEFDPLPGEQALYDRVSEYLGGASKGQRTLMLMVYRKLLGSSTFAVAGAVESLLAAVRARLHGRQAESAVPDYETFEEEAEEMGVEAEAGEEVSPERLRAESRELEECLRLARGIGRNAKGEALKAALRGAFDEAGRRGWPRKAVIFTESLRTQAYLRQLLEEEFGSEKIVLFNGSSGDAENRRRLVARFRDEADILVSTEAGAEGLNLQFCNLVVNYDLPWNPQRVEQRIGRCHRYGQKLDVVVMNFVNRRNAAEERLHDLLATKLKLFEGVFGSSDEILGALEDGVDFERRVFDIFQNCRTPEAIHTGFMALRMDLDEQVEARMAGVRRQILEHFDDEVRLRLRARGRDIHGTLSATERAVRRLLASTPGASVGEPDERGVCRVALAPGLASRAGLRSPFSATFGRPGRDGDKAVERLHLRHPLVSTAIGLARAETLADIQNIALDYTGGGHRITSLQPYLGRRGFWFAWRVECEGLETEDHLAHVILAKRGEGYELLDEECTRHFTTLAAVSAGPIDLPFTEAARRRAADVLASRLDAVVEEAERRNEDEVDHELDKLDRYSEEALMEGVDRLERARKEWEDLKARRSRASGEERRQARARLRRVERSFANQLRRNNEENLRLLDEKDRRARQYESRLRVRVRRERIGVARWEMR